MKLKAFLCVTLLAITMALPAHAYDYTISGVSQAAFYPSTNYEQMYGASYVYDGTNVTDYMTPDLPYGITSNTSIGVMDTPLVTLGTSTGSLFSTALTAPTISYTQPTLEPTISADGVLGTLTIPVLDFQAPIYIDTSTSSLSKGVGHFSNTATWTGNVGIAGHNRGSAYTLGDIKDLDLDDVIKYTTDLGTKVYTVTSVTQISSTDWSRLTATSDNRITLISCVENEPNLRWCVQGTEF
ncbi:class D sortase [Bengtsoniella intestinalis]|uniref:class D sortase n=1 Tax=Bengtsoniella intestinalis TaxID=3073143 RepID=UPI00391F19EE